jgi:hypothetical protein
VRFVYISIMENEEYEIRLLRKQVNYLRSSFLRYRRYLHIELDMETKEICDRAYKYFGNNFQNLEQARWIFISLNRMLEKWVEAKNKPWRSRERAVALWHFGYFRNNLIRDLREWELAS